MDVSLEPSFTEDTTLMIFDLDGTLYEDTKHFDLFADKLKKKLPEDSQIQFSEDYSHVKSGNHPLAIGKVYDAKEDVFWTWDPFTEKLSTPETWDGSLHKEYGNTTKTFPVTSFDFKRWIAIGDGWWPPYVLALHYGIDMVDCHRAYDETKVDMAAEEGWLTQTPGLVSYLQQLKEEKTLVLMTNSDETDVYRLLQHLGLENLFDSFITSAKKPIQTTQHFNELLKAYNVQPEQAISIGDNFMNEIAPALQQGMKSVWLTPDQPPLTHENLCPVTSLTEIMKK
ncbi:HAD-IA family hydrolase [Pontibacillus yanchengensis]|uniref:HAD-IA family hydrolase n=1 Tax=Pontibacillus yanchengensis TaxID=462910 RepID=A0ACC7VKQ9_9BACI|nr:HAD-IA family hydrolase [Pontibacillus yanchengensis]